MRVGAFCGEGPPVPIPNTVVKLVRADNTLRATAREDRSAPTQKKSFRFFAEALFLFASAIKKAHCAD